MAIGSDPEIGVQFRVFGQMTPELQQEWFQHMREVYGPDLVGGYATLAFPKKLSGNEPLPPMLQEWIDHEYRQS
jgi:hypothetical protein